MKVIVFLPENANWRADQLYQGAPIEFARKDGRLERTDDA